MSERDYNAEFEALAEEYRKATGFLAPGKDDPIRNTSDPENVARWDAWLKARRPSPPSGEREATEPLYPCDECGTMRTKAEGGTTFTVCDPCWERLHPKSPTPPSRERGDGFAGSLHGCLTGDCPHADSGECVKALGEEIAVIVARVAELEREQSVPCAVCGKSVTVATVVRCADCERPFCKPCALSHFSEHGDRAATAQISIGELQRQFTAHMERANAERDEARSALRDERERVVRWCWENRPVVGTYGSKALHWRHPESADQYLARALAALDPEAKA